MADQAFPLWSDEPTAQGLLSFTAVAPTVVDAVLDDTIVQNDAAVLQMGDGTLRNMATELVLSIRKNASIDSNLKESAHAAMRSKIRRLLATYDYPPDLEEKAVELVLEQAELFASEGTT